ncbi:hypothetical protein AGMMS50225_02440 [Betaproteobacteria bacterium]|nr:hypothetical protein AGMMS50225_02440 [Betaproteobacteria bacterium]
MLISTFRLRSFLIHVAVSATLAVVAMALVFLVWYPSPLQLAAGVTEIFLIILGVDVTLGPFLTLVLANPLKKRALFMLDLSIIIVIQLTAFAYGIYTVAIERPAWVVFTTDSYFDLVLASELSAEKPDQVLPEFRQASWFGPQFACVPLPDDAKEREDLMFKSFDAVATGVDLFQMPWMYRPLSECTAVIKDKARELDKLNSFNPAEQVQAILAQNPQADGWLPLNSRKNQSVVVLVKKDEGHVVKIVDLAPWD